MEGMSERARAYLDALEAERLAALALSEQKAEEAKLIKARQEGFEAAMQILGGHVPVGSAEVSPVTSEPGRTRRTRRQISELIVRELSFSGQPTTTRQIAKAIDYNIERTEIALQRMEEAGQVHRSEGGRWATGVTAPSAHMNGHAVNGNGKSQELPED